MQSKFTRHVSWTEQLQIAQSNEALSVLFARCIHCQKLVKTSEADKHFCNQK